MALAARFTEGETRIAAALRELEAHGYLHRRHMRLANGRMVTRTVFCNQPGAVLRAGAVVAPQVAPVPEESPAVPEAPPAPAPPPAPDPTSVPEESHPPGPRTAAHRAQAAAPAAPPAPRTHRTASAILADLRSHARELVLSEDDIEELIPGVAAWLEREVRPDVIRHALTTQLPQPPKYLQGAGPLPGLPRPGGRSLEVVVVEVSGRGYARPTGRGGVRGRRVVTTRKLTGGSVGACAQDRRVCRRCLRG